MSHANPLQAGASHGIGHAMVRHLDDAGWRRLIAARHDWIAEAEPVYVGCICVANWVNGAQVQINGGQHV